MRNDNISTEQSISKIGKQLHVTDIIQKHYEKYITVGRVYYV